MSMYRSLMSANDERGHCRSCRWWQAEHEDAELAAGLCMQPELSHFSVQLTADSGCNRFELAMADELVGAVNGV